MASERQDEKLIRPPRHGHREMIVDPFIELMQDRHA
jgi:hypothetical protein